MNKLRDVLPMVADNGPVQSATAESSPEEIDPGRLDTDDTGGITRNMNDSPLSLEALVARLTQIPLLSSLDNDQLAELAARVRVRHYPAGARLIIEGTFGDTLFLIDAGEVEVYFSRSGEQVTIARRGAGAIFGDMALLEGGRRTASVRTLVPSTVIELKKPAFDALLQEHAQIATYVLREMTRRLRNTDSRLVEDLLTINANLRSAQARLEESYDTTLAALSSALDLRDTDTEGHSRRVTEYSLVLGRHVGLDEMEMKALHRGALLHDIGKIGVPDAILRKPGKLLAEELDLMRQHPTWGANVLQDIDFLDDALAVVRHHHEWWDGSGYPDGIAGEEIPLFARIFAVADTFDALASDRPYRGAFPIHKALRIVQDEAGTHLDPSLVQLFTRIFPTVIEPLFYRLHREQR